MKQLGKVFGLLLSGLALVLLTACSAASTATWQQQYDLGMKYLSEGNYQEAIAAFTAAIEIDPKNATIYLGRAEAYAALEQYEQALEDYDSVISIEDQTDEMVVLAHVSRAAMYEKLERYEEAVEDYSTIIALDLQLDWVKINAYLARAFVYGLMGRNEDALEDYTMVIELLGDPETLDEAHKSMLEVCLRQIGELGEAMQGKENTEQEPQNNERNLAGVYYSTYMEEYDDEPFEAFEWLILFPNGKGWGAVQDSFFFEWGDGWITYPWDTRLEYELRPDGTMAVGLTEYTYLCALTPGMESGSDDDLFDWIIAKEEELRAASNPVAEQLKENATEAAASVRPGLYVIPESGELGDVGSRLLVGPNGTAYELEWEMRVMRMHDGVYEEVPWHGDGSPIASVAEKNPKDTYEVRADGSLIVRDNLFGTQKVYSFKNGLPDGIDLEKTFSGDWSVYALVEGLIFE